MSKMKFKIILLIPLFCVNALAMKPNENLLSTRLKADYVELANGKLDKISITNDAELGATIEALEDLLYNNGKLDIPVELSSLKDKISDLKEMIDDPSLYVEKPEHYSEFITLLKERIKSKILELKQFPPGEKERYFKNHQNSKKETIKNQEIMSKVSKPIPGSEKHVILIAPEILEQLKEIMERFFGDVVRLEKAVNDAGFPLRFHFEMGHTGDEVQEAQIKYILEHLPAIPTIPAGISSNDLQPFLQNFILQYLNLLDKVGVIAEFECQSKQNIQDVSPNQSVNSTEITVIAKAIMSRLGDNIKQLESKLNKMGIPIKFVFSLHQFRPFDMAELQQLNAKSFNLPELPQTNNIHNILHILGPYLQTYAEALEAVGIHADIKFKL